MRTPEADQFGALRIQARERRDKAIAAVQSEYAAILAQIATLECGLLGKRPPRCESLGKIIQAAIPRDEVFSIADIVARLEGLDPARVVRWKSVCNYIGSFTQSGLIRRVERHRGHQPSLYAMTGAKVPKRPFEGMTLAAVMRELLTKPMNQTELTVCILEAGYRSMASKKAPRKQVGEILAMPRSGFVKAGGKWTAS